ncbi:MAG: hypothetical protein HC887_06690 [Desulfobacteraceae bacterium]|nr:hypothetical protein [Desulfobacteraceae bacterium]
MKSVYSIVILLAIASLSGCNTPYSPTSQDSYRRQDSGDYQKSADDLKRGRDQSRYPSTNNSTSLNGFRVSVSGGMMNFNGQNLPYMPVSFQIGDGERKTIIFRSLSGSKKGYQTLPAEVEYRQGTLSFDNGKIRLPYESSWENQKNYANLSGERSSGISIMIQKAR